MLTRPDQLERLDQYRRKVSRKKATVESQLRNAIQTQLDGVDKGLGSLREAEALVQEVKESTNEVEQLYQQCADLSDVVRPIKDVNRRHQQLQTTNIHIHNIFNVPTVVQETYDLIREGRLLEAHRNLSELEHTRDELLIQLYQSEDAFVDKNTSLHHYFEPLIGLSDALGQTLWMTMDQMTKLVVSDRRKVVTALRIVEREERADKLVAEMLLEKNVPGSQLPGRPKRWKDKCLEILGTSISNKFEELQPQEIDRMENKGWLAENLTSVAALCYQDLHAMREYGHKCFPPDYKIMPFFFTRYHTNLVKVISDLVRIGLNARDIITLMIWVGDVRESFIETLQIDLRKVGPLIDPSIEEELQTTCHEQVEGNVKELVNKMLETEVEDWISMVPPEADVKGAYYTTIGITLFQMVDQNISALAPLGLRTKLKVLEICLVSISEFQMEFKAEVETYFKNHVASGKREPPHFIEYMIAAANNCKSCVEFADQLKKRFCMELNESMLDAKYERLFKDIADGFEAIGLYCCDILLEVMFIDLRPLLDGLLTKDQWFGSPGDLISNVEATLLDYNQDFSHLKQAHHTYIIVESQQKVLYQYMLALTQKRMVFKKDKDRERAAKMIHDEAKKISTMFLRLSHATNPKYIQVLELLAEVLKSKIEFLPLEISSLASKHPDVKPAHVIAVLAMRGDLNKSGVTKVMQQSTLKEQTDGAPADSSSRRTMTVLQRRKTEEKNIFAEINVPNPYALLGKS